MRAVTLVEAIGPAGVRVVDAAEPEPGPDEVVVEVAAGGLTFPDLLLTEGRYQYAPPLPVVLGSQLAGRVVHAPSDAPFAAGARVCGFNLLGALAERVAWPVGQLLPMPAALSSAAAAASVANYLTAHFVLTWRARLQPGETVLVHGAAGGVGLATLQLAKALGARTIAVASTAEKAAACRESGADVVCGVEGFLDAVRAATDGAGVDVVVDPVGGERFTDSARALRRFGRLVVVGFAAGSIPTVKVNRLLLSNTEVVGAAWGECARAEPGYAAQQWQQLLPLFEAGELSPVLDRVCRVEQAAEALQRLADRAVIGNVVLTFQT